MTLLRSLCVALMQFHYLYVCPTNNQPGIIYSGIFQLLWLIPSQREVLHYGPVCTYIYINIAGTKISHKKIPLIYVCILFCFMLFKKLVMTQSIDFVAHLWVTNQSGELCSSRIGQLHLLLKRSLSKKSLLLAWFHFLQQHPMWLTTS